MSEIMLLGGDGGLEYRLGRFGDDITKISLEETFQPGFDINAALIANSIPDVLLLGPELDQATMLWIAESVDALSVPTAVIAVAEATPKLVLEAMRAGVRDVIDPDAPDDEFRSVLERAREHATRLLGVVPDAERRVDGRTVVVASPKGGVGKSTVAVNIAIDLARTAPSQVVLVDLDLRFGDVATMLDLVPDHSIGDVFASRNGLDTLALKTYLTAHPSGLWVVAAPDSPAAADSVDGRQVKQLLQVLANEFRYVVVDTGSGLDEHTLAALEEATDAVFVSSLDIAGVRNMRKEIELLATVGVAPRRQHLIVNMADRQSGMKPVDVSAVVGLPIETVVPRSSDVMLATNRGIPLLTKKRQGGGAAKGLRAVVAAVLRDEVVSA